MHAWVLSPNALLLQILINQLIISILFWPFYTEYRYQGILQGNLAVFNQVCQVPSVHHARVIFYASAPIVNFLSSSLRASSYEPN